MQYKVPMFKRAAQPLRYGSVVACSVLAGCANGLFGGGGGMLIVPILSRLCGLDAQRAHASAIAAILPMTIASAIVYWNQGGWQWSTGGLVMAGVVAGGALGALLLRKLSGKLLQYVFAALMIGVGIKMAIGG